MNEYIKAIIIYAIIFFIPMVVIAYLWSWLNPVGFFQQLIMLIVSVFFYIFLAIVEIGILIYVTE